MSSYLQRLFNRAATPPAPALAATGQVAPASRLTSPIAEADQRFNLPGFEAIAFDANAPAALESTGQPFAQTPQFLREPPQAANDSIAKFTPPLRAVPDTNGDSSVYGASEVELYPESAGVAF